MKTPLNQTLSVLMLLAAAAGMAPSLAAQRVLAQSPAGAAREPAPNVIISVDDSGSMGWDVNGCMTLDFDTSYYGFLNEPGAINCPSRSSNTNPSRIQSLRNALNSTFGNPALGTKGIIEDERIRLAWQAMWDNGRNSRPSGQTAQQDRMTGGSVNSIKPFTGTHRTNFQNFLESLRAKQGTPSHKMMANVYSYMSVTGTWNPYATEPGVTNSPLLSCRRSYHILMTDGAWNSENETSLGVGNIDGSLNLALPDGTTYNANSTQTRIFGDSFGGTKGTLADWSFANWATDFQGSINDNVRPSVRVTGSETIGSTTLDPYWNPKNNPMRWQGVTQYTIGFGNSATTWAGNPNWNSVSDDTYDGDYSALINGTRDWIDVMNSAESQRPSDLWHAAINGRGKYFPARTDAALSRAFQEILGDILTQTANPLVSIATSSSRLRADGKVFVAGYSSENWSGELGAYTITAGTNIVSSTPTWSAAAQLDTSTFVVNDRLVLTHNGTAGTSFVWGSLTTAQQALIQGSDSSTVGQNRVNYLRGDRSQESQNGGTLRRRDSRLGDIVNSNIWLLGRPSRMAFEHPGHSTFRTAQAGRTPTLFVGANDGMLHGFDAATGKERMAYVPLGVYNKLRDYTLTTYAHQYYVDGHPFSGDADLSYVSGTSTTPDWRTVLVSGLGAGARGYFALDVTTGTYSTSSVLFDKSFSASTTLTSSELDDIGHIFASPVVDPVSGNRSEQIVKLNNGRWAVIMGNGVNSYNERPVLLIQYLDGGKELLRIIAHSTTGQSNGLSAPRPIDVNGNGTADIVYAGDLLGNVWKFNLTSTNAANWGVSNYSGGTTLCKNATTCNPLFVAVDGSGNRQPVTAAPLWMAHPQGGIQVLVGTGLNVTASDRSNTSTQSIYSVWDKGRYSSASGLVTVVDQGNLTATDTRSMLVTQTVLTAVTTTVGGTNTSMIATDFYNTSQNSVTYSWVVSTAKRGWFMDLPAQRERVLAHPQIFEGQKVIVSSNVPKLGATGETCDFDVVTEDNWINVLNMITGKPSTTQVFTSTDATLNANLKFATRTRFGSGEYITINRNDGGADLISLKNDDPNCPQGQLCTERQRLTTGTVPGARADWRQVR